MQRLLAAIAAGTLFAAAGAANAADISVSIGAELQTHARAYGDSELALLRKELTESVQRALAKTGAAPVQRVDLVIESATPNRPTFNEMGAEPGLSLSSVGLGGAAVTGTVTGPDGTARPISFRRHETDFHRVTAYSTWTDAEMAFDSLASAIAHGEAPNVGPYRPDLHADAAFDDLGRLRSR